MRATLTYCEDNRAKACFGSVCKEFVGIDHFDAMSRGMEWLNEQQRILQAHKIGGGKQS